MEEGLYEMLVNYGMDERSLSMWRQGTLTDETGEPKPLESVWWRTGYEDHSPSLYQLLVRLTRLLVKTE